MAEVYEILSNGMKLTEFLAKMDNTQDYMDEVLFTAKVRAEEFLQQVRAEEGYTGDYDSFIETDRGAVDRYLIYNDERGQKAALSIEYGRADIIHSDGTRTKGTDGKYILHRAFDIPRKFKHRRVRYE